MYVYTFLQFPVEILSLTFKVGESFCFIIVYIPDLRFRLPLQLSPQKLIILPKGFKKVCKTFEGVSHQAVQLFCWGISL